MTQPTEAGERDWTPDAAGSMGQIQGWLHCCSGPVYDGGKVRLHFEGCRTAAANLLRTEPRRPGLTIPTINDLAVILEAGFDLTTAEASEKAALMWRALESLRTEPEQPRLTCTDCYTTHATDELDCADCPNCGGHTFVVEPVGHTQEADDG